MTPLGRGAWHHSVAQGANPTGRAPLSLHRKGTMDEPFAAPRSRRALLAAAAGSAAALAASAALPLSLAAHDADDVQLGAANPSTAATSITNATADSDAFAASAAGTGIGVSGTSTGGAGVWAWSISGPSRLGPDIRLLHGGLRLLARDPDDRHGRRRRLRRQRRLGRLRPGQHRRLRLRQRRRGRRERRRRSRRRGARGLGRAASPSRSSARRSSAAPAGRSIGKGKSSIEGQPRGDHRPRAMSSRCSVRPDRPMDPCRRARLRLLHGLPEHDDDRHRVHPLVRHQLRRRTMQRPTARPAFARRVAMRAGRSRPAAIGRDDAANGSAAHVHAGARRPAPAHRRHRARRGVRLTGCQARVRPAERLRTPGPGRSTSAGSVAINPGVK